MKKTLIALMTVVAAAATACTPKELAESAITPEGKFITLTINAEQEAPTRTYIEKAEGGWQPYWSEQDSVFVTLGTDLSKAYRFTNTSGEGTTASFTGKIPEIEGELDIYAFTPGKAGRAEDIFKFDISPAQELPSLNSFDPHYDLLVSNPLTVTVNGGQASAAAPLHFNRLLAVVKVVLADGTSDSSLSGKAIKSVKLISSAETLSGRIRVKITDKSIDGFEKDGKNNFVGATYEGDDWKADGTTGGFVILAPCTLEAGSDLTLEATLADGTGVLHKTTLTEALELKSGVLPTLRFTVLDKDFAPYTLWDFGSAEWQAAFEAQAPAAKETKASGWSTSLNGLTYTSGKDDRWFTAGYVQPNGGGSEDNRVFTFTAPADGSVEVCASNTGNSAATSARNIVVANDGTTQSKEAGSAPSIDPVTLSFDVKAGKVAIYPDASLRIYSIKYIGGIVTGDTPDDPDTPEDPGEATVWDFSTSAWQAEFAKLGSAATELAAVELTYAGLTIKGDAKSKYNTTYWQTCNVGSTSGNYFKFNAPEAGLVTVNESHTGSSAPNPIRYICVYNNGNEQQIEGSVNSKAPKNCCFNVVAGDVYIYGTGGARFYTIKFEAGKSIEPAGPDDPDNPDDPSTDPTGEDGELTIPESEKPATATVDPTKMYGYAEAAGVTGGEGASQNNILHFDNGKALQTWLLARAKSEKKGDHSPVIIWLSGTFGPSDGRDFSEAHPWFDVKEVSNLSFFGTDDFVMDRIGLFLVRSSNIVIRNINFQQPKANNGADAVSMQESEGVWVDHCTFTSLNQTKDYEDGSTDVTHGSNGVTVSWCRYIKTQKSCLVGHSNNQSSDTQITATFHHNWFDGSSSRHPRVRFGRAHVYNNLYDGCTTYGVGSAYGAKVLVEYNYFDGVQLPTDICSYPAKENGESNLTGSVAGYLFAGEDILVNRPAKAKDPYPLTNLKYKSYNGETLSTPLTYADFKPSYSYVVTPAANVPEVVKAGAGYGKLGWTEAPVAVNNGGITEYNGTDDNPTDPATGDEPGDEPSGDGTYSLYVKADKSIAASGSYFSYSTNIADFSKDYSGSFTIGGTEYAYGLKMDSKGSVSFTTSASKTTTVQFFFARRKSGATGAKMQLVPSAGEPQVFETAYDNYSDSGVITLEKGISYTIKQKSDEQAIILVKVTEN